MPIKKAEDIKRGDILAGGAKVVGVYRQGDRVIIRCDRGAPRDERPDQKLHVK